MRSKAKFTADQKQKNLEDPQNVLGITLDW